MIHAMSFILIDGRATVAPIRHLPWGLRPARPGHGVLPPSSSRLRDGPDHFNGFSGSWPASALSLRQVASGCERAETMVATSCVPGRALIFRQAQP